MNSQSEELFKRTKWESMKLESQLNYFRKHQKELARKHHGKYALIHGEQVDGVFDSELEAYSTAKKKYTAGTFLIRKCLEPKDETTQVFHSRVAL